MHVWEITNWNKILVSRVPGRTEPETKLHLRHRRQNVRALFCSRHALFYTVVMHCFAVDDMQHVQGGERHTCNFAVRVHIVICIGTIIYRRRTKQNVYGRQKILYLLHTLSKFLGPSYIQIRSIQFPWLIFQSFWNCELSWTPMQ